MSVQRVLWLVLRLFTVGIIALVPSAMAEEGVRPPAAAASSDKGPSSSRKPTEQRSIITVKDGRLSVQVQNRPLSWVLEEISREARVAIIRADGVGGQPVSIQFRDLPLDEGFRQILKDEDAFFFYGVEEKAPASLRAVWVYPKGQGRGLAPVPPEAWASTKEVEGRLADPNPEVRAQAVEAFVERKGEHALDAVLQAFSDENDEVRTQALYGALSSGVELPADALINLALGDPSSDVRFLALEALADDPNVGGIAQRGLNDPSPHVQNKAQEILNRLDAATRSPASSQPAQGQARPQGE